ncbi:MAG: membrane protein insertase YidC [Pseudomonadota bacterium]
MDLNSSRTFLGISVIVLSSILWLTWLEDHKPAPAISSPLTQGSSLEAANSTLGISSTSVARLEESTGSDVRIETDMLSVRLNTHGGDISYVGLKQYDDKPGSQTPFPILVKDQQKFYAAQSGLIGLNGPDTQNARAVWQSAASEYTMQPNAVEPLTVVLTWQAKGGLDIEKRYTFKPNHYDIEISYTIRNQGRDALSFSPYEVLKRTMPEQSGGFFSGGASFVGAALSTPQKPYEKIGFDKMLKKPVDRLVEGGWISMQERYFVTAWIPSNKQDNRYFSRVDAQSGVYSVGVFNPVLIVQPGETITTSALLFVGPERVDILKGVAKGLDLTVDYGILWPVSQSLLWVLRGLYDVLGNWGWSIIALTILIKIVFYRFQSKAMRSMNALKQLQPKIEALRVSCGEDKVRFNQEMMQLYKREKVNPMGGCLPLLIQLPVSIGIYYMLLESVELRHAPFMFWITDLAGKDPYYVVPILTAVTMWILQSFSPKPTDPVQGTVLKTIPILLGFVASQCPVGLGIYWVSNNLVSALQQWLIMKRLDTAR